MSAIYYPHLTGEEIGLKAVCADGGRAVGSCGDRGRSPGNALSTHSEHLRNGSTLERKETLVLLKLPELNPKKSMSPALKDREMRKESDC